MGGRVGFIGLGKMGGPMVRRLLANGYELCIRDVAEAALAPFRDHPGITICASPRHVAECAPVVLLSLPSRQALFDVALGPDGVAAAGPGRCVIDLSTSGVKASRAVAGELKTRGSRFLDAPVSGGVPGAEKGTLSVMVAQEVPALRPFGGRVQAIVDARNIFEPSLNNRSHYQLAQAPRLVKGGVNIRF